MTSFRPSEVQDCANRLYAIARSIIISSTFVGLAAGGSVAGMLANANDADSIGLWLLIGAAFGAASGYEIGMTRAVGLRLQAQNALCLVEIESNTGREETAALQTPIAGPLSPSIDPDENERQLKAWDEVTGRQLFDR